MFFSLIPWAKMRQKCVHCCLKKTEGESRSEKKDVYIIMGKRHNNNCDVDPTQ